MNTPNKLTLLRAALVPVCLALLALGYRLPCAILFAAACVTDHLDGRIARKRQLVTNFGKFADPIADKVLTLSMMILMACRGLMPVWLPIIVCIRELMVDGLRLIALEKGQVVAAGWSGKVKTVQQMAAILTALVLNVPWLNLALAILVAALTVYSGAEYFWSLRELFRGDLRQ